MDKQTAVLYLLLIAGVAFLLANSEQIREKRFLHLLNAIKRPQRRMTQAQRQMFTRADVHLKKNQGHKHLSRMFNHRQGIEYCTRASVQKAAKVTATNLLSFIKGHRIDITRGFDCDGNPTNPAVIGVGTVDDCPYDEANSKACLTDGKYREPTARCTNQENGKKTWGMAMTPYTRVLRPVYEDKIGERRKTEFSSGRPFKSPRDISTAVTDLTVTLMDGYNVQIMQWGQFSAHEFTHLAESKSDVECCPDKLAAAKNGPSAKPSSSDLAEIRKETEQFRGDVCMPIETENNNNTGEYLCMEQTRTQAAPLHSCLLGPRQQMNAITHVFDASAVYGSSLAEREALRDSEGGRMKTQTVNGNVLPPPDLEDCPSEQKSSNRCPFKGGDTRINTTPNLISTHGAFLNIHNKVAAKLSSLNPHWKHNRIFQETRRVITGIQTSIHYYEYLPLIIGQNMIRKYKLDRYRGFKSNINPSALNELAHAAYRFGHSTVSDIFHTIDDNGASTQHILAEEFDNPKTIYDGGIAQCLRGIAKDKPWKVDRFYPQSMREFLLGLRQDIIAFNLNRGRDHGLSSYVDYRRHYRLSVPRSWDDMRDTHEDVVVDSLRKVYTTVNDVELYMAGVTEKPMGGAMVGELFANIMGEGFYKMMAGDRLFFGSKDFGFNSGQVTAIKNYKYNKFLCDAGNLDTIGSNAFIIAGQLNTEEVSCSQLPGLNLNLWRERGGPQPPPQPQPQPRPRPQPRPVVQPRPSYGHRRKGILFG